MEAFALAKLTPVWLALPVSVDCRSADMSAQSELVAHPSLQLQLPSLQLPCEWQCSHSCSSVRPLYAHTLDAQ